METPDIPANEAERLHALRMLELLDSAFEERFDRITRMAQRMFGVPVSMISLVDADRQWFKSVQGWDKKETSREISFCGHAINQDGLFIVPDASKDHRFHDNPLVANSPYIRFYAAFPLKLRQDIKVGTICLIDQKPRKMAEEDCQLLEDLGTMVEQEIKSIQMATLDELTLVSNRRGFLTIAELLLRISQRKKLNNSILLFDLDKFKEINDNFGHHEGDNALKTFSFQLLKTFRESDIVARWGGDEFIVFLNDTTQEIIHNILLRFNDNMTKLNLESDKPYQIDYSVGFSHFQHDDPLSIEQRIQSADENMYAAKSSKASN